MTRLTTLGLGLALLLASTTSAFAQDTSVMPTTETETSQTTTTNTDDNGWMDWWWLVPLIGLPLLLILTMSGNRDEETEVRTTREPQVTYHDVKKTRVKKTDTDDTL